MNASGLAVQCPEHQLNNDRGSIECNGIHAILSCSVERKCALLSKPTVGGLGLAIAFIQEIQTVSSELTGNDNVLDTKRLHTRLTSKRKTPRTKRVQDSTSITNKGQSVRRNDGYSVSKWRWVRSTISVLSVQVSYKPITCTTFRNTTRTERLQENENTTVASEPLACKINFMLSYHQLFVGTPATGWLWTGPMGLLRQPQAVEIKIFHTHLTRPQIIRRAQKKLMVRSDFRKHFSNFINLKTVFRNGKIYHYIVMFQML